MGRGNNLSAVQIGIMYQKNYTKCYSMLEKAGESSVNGTLAFYNLQLKIQPSLSSNCDMKLYHSIFPLGRELQ